MQTKINLIAPTRVINMTAILQPLFQPTTASLVPMRRQPMDVRLIRSRAMIQETGLARSLPKQESKLARVAPATFSVTRVKGTVRPVAGREDVEMIGAADLRLPFGISRFVNVATLKKMLRASRSDVVLRKTGRIWEIVPDSAKVDLRDPSVEYRIGAVQVYS